MDCQSCSDEIPDDSIFCPECGARQDLSNAGGRSFGVVTPQAIQAAGQDDEGGQPAPQPMDVDTLNRLAFQMKTGQTTEAAEPVPTEVASANMADAFDGGMSGTNQIVDQMVDAEKENKSEARTEWLSMNQQTATDVLSQVNAELPPHLRRDDSVASGAASFLEDALGDSPTDPSDGPSVGLLRRMAEVAVRRVARKRGVAVESPQISLEGDMVRVNVTYIDDGRVLDTPSDLSNAFSHAIQTEVALKGLELSVSVVLFSSTEGEVSHVWGDAPEEEEVEDEEEKFACEACGHYPVMESDPACPNCGAMFEDDDEDDDYDGPGSAPPNTGGPPRGPSRGPAGPSRGGPPSRGPGGPSRGGPPSRGPGGPSGGGPSRGGPPSRGPGGPSGGGPSRGGPPSRGPGGPSGGGPSRGGPPSRGPGGPGGPPKGRGGPPKRGGPPSGPKKRGPPR